MISGQKQPGEARKQTDPSLAVDIKNTILFILRIIYTTSLHPPSFNVH